MTLKKLITLQFNEQQLNDYSTSIVLHKNQLELILNDLSKTYEFKNSEVILIDEPHLFYTDENLMKKNLLIERKNEVEIKTLNANNFFIRDNKKIQFKGRFYLFSITLTPEIFDFNKSLKPVKDGACISPDMYSPFDFSQKKKVMFEFNVENDIELNIKNAKKILEKIMRNENDYRIKGDREIIIRGVFEEEINKELINNIVFKIKNKPLIVHYLKMCIEEEGGIVQTKMGKVIIPNKLKKHFEEEFPQINRHLTINEESINNFLKKYNEFK